MTSYPHLIAEETKGYNCRCKCPPLCQKPHKKNGRTAQESSPGNMLDWMPPPNNPDEMTQRSVRSISRPTINPERQENTKASFCLEGKLPSGKFQLGLNGFVSSLPQSKESNGRFSCMKAGLHRATPPPTPIREKEKATNTLRSQGQLPVLNIGAKLSVKHISLHNSWAQIRFVTYAG